MNVSIRKKCCKQSCLFFSSFHPHGLFSIWCVISPVCILLFNKMGKWACKFFFFFFFPQNRSLCDAYAENRDVLHYDQWVLHVVSFLQEPLRGKNILFCWLMGVSVIFICWERQKLSSLQQMEFLWCILTCLFCHQFKRLRQFYRWTLSSFARNSVASCICSKTNEVLSK